MFESVKAATVAAHRTSLFGIINGNKVKKQNAENLSAGNAW